MADIHLYPNMLFGRNRDEPELWVGYVEADAGTVSSPTKLDLAQTDQAGNQDDLAITFDAVNNELDLAASNAYLIIIQVDQTGASGSIEVYNVTGSAILFTTADEEGEKILVRYLRTTTAISISIRADDQTANSTGADESVIMVYRLGAVQT